MFIVTSLNPFGRIQVQLDCFKTWKEMGYNIKSINVKAEAEKLFECGMDNSDIILINDENTNYNIFSKKIPKIRVCFDLFNDNKYNNNQFLIVNSDIYPAFIGKIEKYFKNISSGIGFTRKEVENLYDLSSKEIYKHYRGGVDVFYFDNTGLDQIRTQLEKNLIYERMTFGIPGWDFYLSYLMRNLNMKIMDSEVFLHQSHTATYTEIAEFKNYSILFKDKKYFPNDNFVLVAEKFAAEINNECFINQNISKTIKVMFLKQKLFANVKKEVFFEDLLKEHNINCEKMTWANLKNIYSKEPRFNTTFKLTILNLLLETSQFSRNEKYPEGNLHNKALRIIYEDKNDETRFNSLYFLFCDELFDYGILNKRTLALMGTTLLKQNDLILFQKISTIFKG
jgi:hypothetical protein